MRKCATSLALVLAFLTLIVLLLASSYVALSAAEGSAMTDPATVATIVPTATIAAGCNVSAESFIVRGNEAALQLVNHGAGAASIRAVEIAWPASDNGALTEVRLANRLVWHGERGTSPTIIVPDTTGITPPSVLPEDSAPISFVFATVDGNAIVERHYTVSISFQQGCRALYSTRETVATVCRVEAGSFAARGHKAALTLHNAGEADAELRAIQIAWPAEHNGALARIKAGNVTLWEGERVSSPTVIAPTTSAVRPVLHAGERIILTFTFSHSAAAEPYAITAYFIEGCHAFFSTQVRPAPRRTVRLSGMIDALPEEGLLGAWTVARHSVLVDERTIIEPRDAQPAVGDEVKVTAIVLQDTTQVSNIAQLLAIHIHLTRTRGGRNIEFRGTIQAISEDGLVIIVRDINVIIDDHTQIQGQLAVGSLAHVSGRQRGNDTVLAERIVVMSAAVDVAVVQFEGPVEAFPADWLGEWQIGGHTVIVDETTVIEGAPALGALAEVRAHLANDGTLLATHIIIHAERATPVTNHISGVIVGLPSANSLLGDWIIGDAAGLGNVTVSVTQATFVDQSHARARIGAPVDVHIVPEAGGVWRAIRITVKRED